MPDEEVLEEGVLNPIKTEIQDPLLQAILEENSSLLTAPIGLEQPDPLPDPVEEVDCVVIGTGAGGAPLLARLAMAGLKVVALEAGPRRNPITDYATDEKAQAFLFWNDERLSAGQNPVAFGNNNSGTGVGGSTLHYTAYTPRAQDDDLHLHRDFGVGVDWPFGLDELEPYYSEIEQFLGVSGPTPYPWSAPRSKGYPLAPLPLNGAALLMQQACAQLGIQTSPAANAALSARYYQEGVGWREACTNRGFCQAGCNVGAKASMDVTFLPLAEAHGAEIRADAFVTEIERDEKGRVTGVVYEQYGVTVRQRCRHLFLCAGAVETPRLLLLNELALTSGQVGKHFMAHPGMQVWGTFSDDIRPHKGIPGGLISEDTHRPKDADFAGGYLLQSIGVMPVTFASQMARGRKLWGQQLRDYMRNYNHISGINILGDCLPHTDNFLELAEEKDARGLPKPRLHFTAQENELRMNVHSEKLMREIWTAAGATDLWSFERYAHVIGTARMGLSGDDAVVNPDGRAFDVPNLYICDNSVFPSALSVNPALTIMALSLRTADKFLAAQARLDGNN
ncbi:GMC family oxidoreductase [Hymenobacter sp.]|jgi:choline dehydrogenase-like flavoprotein|uniref:GMC family oxidoreductase n=1 Tax=Hymenobacter sp. TaxID=1898978 RepID=UPI002ED828A8